MGIADLRDPWTDIYYYHLFYPTIIAKAIDRYFESSVLKNVTDHYRGFRPFKPFQIKKSAAGRGAGERIRVIL